VISRYLYVTLLQPNRSQMSADRLQPLLDAGEECKNLLGNFKGRGRQCSERIQALVNQISLLCRTLQEHHDAAGSDTSAYANYPSCLLSLQECHIFLNGYVEKSRNAGNSLLGTKYYEEKKLLILERKIQEQLDMGVRSAQHDIL
jgi:hypothetical protein